SQNNANGDTDFWKTYTTYGVGGSKTAGLYTDGNAGNNNDYLILPAFQLTGNQWLKFYVRARTSSEPNDYRVVLSTTGTLPADFTVELKPLTTVSSTTMTEIEPINLSAYTGTVYIAIHVPSGGLDGYYIYFDNFTIEDMPSCLPMTGVTVNGFTETTAQISWTASASNPADGYDIYYSTSSTAPDAGTTPNLNVGAGETSVEITGLTASSTYYVWVRSDCGGGDYSTWSNAVSFYTGYCIPAPTSQDGFGITNVTFGQTVVVNNTTGSETGFYGNYSNMVGDGAQGTILNVSITYATGYTYGTKIWVDWNNDLDFVDAGEQMYFGLSTNSNPTTLAASFTIPLATPLGNYRMRIGGTDNDAGPSTPCQCLRTAPRSWV
ncbi:MAG TPA: choice-of-anchor J domain-containing protein, partial [Bacteroidales bacterium]|nr:choice-of-anchor J domain-containing protein [Bacteroidales bacterium]